MPKQLMFEGKAYFVAGARETPFTLHYYADSRDQAVERFLKWIDDRMEAVPEIFDKLGIVSIREYEPDVINERGQLVKGLVAEFFLWKEGLVHRDPFSLAPGDWKPVRGIPDPLGMDRGGTA